LPHLLAISTNSPFWSSRYTGIKSYRSALWKRVTRSGMPGILASYDDFDQYVQALVETGCIDNAKKIWWDMRPHPFFDTLEFRVCDVPLRVDETICFAALFQAITVKLYRLYEQNMGWRLYRRSLINENKSRAARFGIDGKLI